MGKILAWTEGTFVDLTDGKQIQAYLNYNQPLTIQYDPEPTLRCQMIDIPFAFGVTLSLSTRITGVIVNLFVPQTGA